VIQVSDDPGPGPFTDGDRYLVGGAAAGVFAGHDNEVAEYESSTTSWYFEVATAADALVVENVDGVYIVAEDDTAIIYRPGLVTAFKWQIFPDQLWYDNGGHFSNAGLVTQDSDFVGESDVDGAGFGGTSFSLQNLRSLPDVEPAISSFNLLEMGHGGNPVFRFTPDGHPVILANPTTGEYVWDDLVSDGILVAAGVGLPPLQVYRGSIEIRHWAVNDQGNLNFHFKHRYVPGTPACVHIHGKLRTGTIATTALIKFELEYIKGQTGSVDAAPVTVSKEFDISNLAQFTEVLLEFDQIAMAGYVESSNLTVRIKRIAASADEYGDLLAIPEIDCHIQQNKLGTRQELPPFTP
jgi:hypothetical protein